MLVSIGIPVRNAADRLENAVRSALAQDYADIEVVISDNASTDGTEELCRELARADSRLSYHRQERNLGAVGNFKEVIRVARGQYFRWLGDDDFIEPDNISRSLEPFRDDPRLILVTSDLRYTDPDGTVHLPRYRGRGMLSDDPVDRLDELWEVCTTEHQGLDPLYALLRREWAMRVPRPLMIREDEVFATMLALTAPWGHVPVLLGRRELRRRRLTSVAEGLGVPRWTAYFANTLQLRGMLSMLRNVELTPGQLRRARRVIMRTYGRKQRAQAGRRGRRLLGLATGAWKGRNP